MPEHRINTAHDPDLDRGYIAFPVRKDDLTKQRDEPTGIPQADGDFAILEVDEDGYLRVRLKDDSAKVSEAQPLEDLLIEQNSLLRRMLLALEMLHGQEIHDPK